MKRPLALLALAGVHYANGQQRRALAALASATEDPEFNEAIETVNTAVSDDELPSELDDVVESSDDDDIAAEDLVDDVEALEPEEVEALADGVVEDDELNVDADDLNLDTPEAVVSSLLDAGAAPSTIQRHVRNLLIAGLSDLGADDDGDEDEDDSDLQGFDEEACGGPMKATASVSSRRSRNMKDVIAANLKALSR
jgi:hypothetical protein